MTLYVIYGHPQFSSDGMVQSFTAELCSTFVKAAEQAGHTVLLKNLYDMVATGTWSSELTHEDLSKRFDGDMADDIAREQTDLMRSDVLVMFYPVWWWSVPAIIKGWCDRTLQYGFAFEKGKGLLTHLQSVVFQTAGNSKEFHDELNIHEVIERPLREGTLEFCGIRTRHFETLFSTTALSDIERADILDRVRLIAENLHISR